MLISCKHEQNVTLRDSAGMFEVHLFGACICSTLSGSTASRIYVDLVAWLHNNDALFS